MKEKSSWDLFHSGQEQKKDMEVILWIDGLSLMPNDFQDYRFINHQVVAAIA